MSIQVPINDINNFKNIIGCNYSDSKKLLEFFYDKGRSLEYIINRYYELDNNEEIGVVNVFNESSNEDERISDNLEGIRESDLEVYQRGLYGENSENIDDILNESLYDSILITEDVTDDMINRNIVSCSHEENTDSFNENCTICMENNTDCMLRGCLHKFHKNCISRWLKEKPCCPLCNKDIR